jgi:hypothetical protein
MGNWNIGKRITNVLDINSSKSKYGEELITNLSRDLTRELGKGFSPRNLRSFSKFHTHGAVTTAPRPPNPPTPTKPT